MFTFVQKLNHSAFQWCGSGEEIFSVAVIGESKSRDVIMARNDGHH